MRKKGSLLWVDDVLLITTGGAELQQSLDITDDTSKTYHIEYGQSKSNSQIIKRKNKAAKSETFKLGDVPLDNTDKYKYLGYIQNSKNNNEDHIKYIKGQKYLYGIANKYREYRNEINYNNIFHIKKR